MRSIRLAQKWTSLSKYGKENALWILDLSSIFLIGWIVWALIGMAPVYASPKNLES